MDRENKIKEINEYFDKQIGYLTNDYLLLKLSSIFNDELTFLDNEALDQLFNDHIGG